MEQQKLPNSTLILVFGILSIVTCCCYGVVGIILGAVALVLANQSLKLYNANPEIYSDVSNVKTGRILAIIGIFINLLVLVFLVGIVSYFGWEAMQDPELLQERLKELQGM